MKKAVSLDTNKVFVPQTVSKHYVRMRLVVNRCTDCILVKVVRQENANIDSQYVVSSHRATVNSIDILIRGLCAKYRINLSDVEYVDINNAEKVS